MKAISGSIISGLCALFQVASAQDSTILWTENAVLEWADFRAVPPEHHEASAITDVTLRVDIRSEGDKLMVVIEPVFNRYGSWSKSAERSPELLKHEQLHFDIHEMNARKLRADLKGQTITMNNVEGIVDRLMKEHATMNMDEQDRYDNETNHSLRKEKQAEWNAYVAGELKKLKAHSNGKFSLRISGQP